MESLIRKTLDKCGYCDDAATEENLKLCFLDYVDAGVFGNLDVEMAIEEIEEGEITTEKMCYNLLKIRC